MKKIILGVALALAAINTNAQEGGFAKGDLFATGAVAFGSTKDNNTDAETSSFTLVPQVGYFVTENIAAGARISYSSSEVNDVKSNALGLGAFGRYYTTPASQFSFFGQVGLDYNTSNPDTDGDVKVNTIGLGAGLGLNYFVSSNFSLEAGLNLLSYSSSKADVDGAESVTSFNFGDDFTNLTFGVNYKF